MIEPALQELILGYVETKKMSAIKKATNFYRTPHPKRLLKWILACLVIIPVGWLAGVVVINYSGYCFDEGRYLTDKERIRHAVEVILENYPRVTYAYDKLPKAGYEVIDEKSRCCDQGDRSRFDGSEGGSAINAEQLIFYKDLDEFFALNPDCCRFERNGLFGERISADLWPKITGYSAGFVSVKFRVRYRDADGNERSKFSAVSWSYTACGAPSIRLSK